MIRVFVSVPPASAAGTLDPAARYEVRIGDTLLANTDGLTSVTLDQNDQPETYTYAGQAWTYLGTYVIALPSDPSAAVDDTSVTLKITQSAGLSVELKRGRS